MIETEDDKQSLFVYSRFQSWCRENLPLYRNTEKDVFGRYVIPDEPIEKEKRT